MTVATEKKEEPVAYPKVAKIQEERKASEDDDMGLNASVVTVDSSPTKTSGLGSSNASPVKIREEGASPVRTIPSRLGSDKKDSGNASMSVHFGIKQCEGKD